MLAAGMCSDQERAPVYISRVVYGLSDVIFRTSSNVGSKSEQDSACTSFRVGGQHVL